MKMLCGDQTMAYIAGGRSSEELHITGKTTLTDRPHVHPQLPSLWLIHVLILLDQAHVHMIPCCNAVQAVLMKLLDCACSLNTFMAESQLPPSLRARLREFFRYRRSARSLHDCPDLLQAMSPALRAQVASHTQAKWVNTVPFFRWTQLLMQPCQHFASQLSAEVVQQHAVVQTYSFMA